MLDGQTGNWQHSDDGDSATLTERPQFDAIELRVLQLVAAGTEAGPVAPRSALARRFQSIGRFLTGSRAGATLANDRLEALRSQAVIALRGSRDTLSDFVAAGYSACHAEAIRTMMAVARPRVSTDRMMRVAGIAIGFGAVIGFFGLTAAMMTMV